VCRKRTDDLNLISKKLLASTVVLQTVETECLVYVRGSTLS